MSLEVMALAWKTLEDVKHNHKLMALVNGVTVEAWDKYQMDLRIFQAQEALRQAIEQDAKRDWVGLTDEERFLDDCRSHEELEYAKAIESKLKEKNV